MPSAKKEKGVRDMILLDDINQDSLIDNLEKRFKDDSIYTYIGNVVISVNPYKDLGLYGASNIQLYRSSFIHQNNPHIYALGNEIIYTSK